MKTLNIQFHNKLCPTLWVGDELKPNVKKALIKVADEFFKFLKVNSEPADIILLGSMANYNYTKYSDIDLHLVIDFSALNKDMKLIKNYFDAKKFIWNNNHNIKIYGHEIECYVQDISEKNASTALYSLKYDKWIKKPKKEKPKIDAKEILIKSKDFIKRIEMAKGDLESLNTLKDKLKTMRKSGLEKEAGEYSTENMVFKTLRNSKNIEKLMNYAKEIYDKELSLKKIHESSWLDLKK